MRFCIDFFLNSDRPACFSVYYLYYVEAYFPYAFGFNVDCIAFIKVASMVEAVGRTEFERTTNN